MLVAFIVLVCLLGGGSRDDIASLVWLRPLSVIFVGYGLWVMSRDEFRAIRPALLPLGLLGAWMLAQLIPLPQDVWSALPGRKVVADIGAAIGLGDVARPITLSPSATLNSLASLFVPLAALLLLAIQIEGARHAALTTLWLVALVGAMLGFLQLMGGGNGGFLYPYAFTNPDSAVGLFANRNHNAVFQALALVMAGQLLVEERARRNPREYMVALLLASMVIFIVSILLIGSRAGAITGGIAVVATLAIIHPLTRQLAAPVRQGAMQQALSVALRFGPLLIVAGLVAVFVWASRAQSIDRLVNQGFDDGKRDQVLPVLADMALSNQPFGVGMGAFEHAFRMVEPDQMLSAAYLNEAHNDLMQVVIEGGVPVILILILAFVGAGRGLWAMWQARGSSVTARGAVIALGAMIVIEVVASAFDYPLRTPAHMLALAVIGGFAALGGTGFVAHVRREKSRR